MKAMKGVMGKVKVDVILHGALIFLVGMGMGVAITYFGFEGNFSDYRKAEFKGQQLEMDRYLQVLENSKVTDAEAREDLKASMKNKIQYYKDMQRSVD